MGSDDPCKFINIGPIQIIIHYCVVRTLTKVCHIPELKKNLVLVGANQQNKLDSKFKIQNIG